MELKEIAKSKFVTKAYITPDEHFLKVENINGAVYTIWAKHYGYQMTSPIKSNLTTGSSTMVLGEGEFYYDSLNDVMAIIKNGVSRCPYFFSDKDREATHFLTIEQAVELHGNILNFKKIK